jgi:hypothetical protein
MEQFEPLLDLWVISSYPFVVYQSDSEIPSNFYSSLLTQTYKPLAVAEGGYTSTPVDSVSGTRQDQVDYLDAMHSQIGGARLSFWIYLLLNDLNLNSYANFMKQGVRGGDVNTLGMFTSVGLTDSNHVPKPALAAWDSFRK